MQQNSISSLTRSLYLAVLAVLLATTGCGSGDGSGAAVAEFVAQESDFECLTVQPRVRNLRIVNKLGRLDEALELAENPDAGKQFPVGTILQLFPGEAMVKRGGGFDPDNKDWEYFELAVSAAGTTIRKRGRDDVINMFGGQCFGCHEAARDFDFICEKANGCVPLPIGDSLIDSLQRNDPRCAPVAAGVGIETR
jgi:hypothetical protein